MKKKKIIQSLLFLLIGITLFAYAYKDLDFHKIEVSIKDLKFEWIILSFLFGLLSHLIRAVRWRMLIEPMGYRPGLINLFLSVLVLYFTNLIIPRGGEIARCGVITKYEKIPFTKLVGTVFVERVTDLMAFFAIFLVILFWQFPAIERLLTSSDVIMDFEGMKMKLIFAVVILGGLILLYYLLNQLGLFNSFRDKLQKIKHDFTEGLRSILDLKQKGLYIFYTFFIFLMWLLMLYVVFFAYAPTEKLSFSVAIFTYAIGTFAYLLPIQAGIGVWHLIVIHCLFMFGIDKESGMIFALIAHTFTNVIYLIFGALGFVLLPIVNNSETEEVVLLDQVVTDETQT